MTNCLCFSGVFIRICTKNFVKYHQIHIRYHLNIGTRELSKTTLIQCNQRSNVSDYTNPSFSFFYHFAGLKGLNTSKLLLGLENRLKTKVFTCIKIFIYGPGAWTLKRAYKSQRDSLSPFESPCSWAINNFIAS